MNTEFDQQIDTLRKELRDIELDVTTSYTLADAIREGCGVTEQAIGDFGAGPRACALSAALIAAKARDYIK
jgi:hypothetical protein